MLVIICESSFSSLCVRSRPIMRNTYSSLWLYPFSSLLPSRLPNLLPLLHSLLLTSQNPHLLHLSQSIQSTHFSNQKTLSSDLSGDEVLEELGFEVLKSSRFADWPKVEGSGGGEKRREGNVSIFSCLFCLEELKLICVLLWIDTRFAGHW